MLRDVIARETPTLIRSGSELYAVPAAAGAGVVAVAWELGVYGPVLGAASAVAVFAVRGLALRQGVARSTPRLLTEQAHEALSVRGVVAGAELLGEGRFAGADRVGELGVDRGDRVVLVADGRGQVQVQPGRPCSIR